MTALIIANTQIRCDTSGRYCLNDLHQASGGAEKNQPNRWLRLQQTQELVAQVAVPTPEMAAPPPDMAAVVTVSEGFGVGTYAVKELVYAYAMWISAAFHLHVIRAYDALVTSRAIEIEPALSSGPQHRADQLVSAGRIFGAALRTARAMRMPADRALLSAFECTTRNVGVDWLQELDAGDLIVAATAAANDESDIARRVGEWVAGRSQVSAREIISGAEIGDPENRSLQMRIAIVMRDLGYRKVRSQATNRQWAWRKSFNA